jgi:hypothetical protein
LANAPTSALQNAGRPSGLRLDTNVFGPREHSTSSSSTQLTPALADLRNQLAGVEETLADLRRDQLGCAARSLDGLPGFAAFDLFDAFGRHQERNRLAVQ